MNICHKITVYNACNQFLRGLDDQAELPSGIQLKPILIKGHAKNTASLSRVDSDDIEPRPYSMDDEDDQLYHNGDGRRRERGGGMAPPQIQYHGAAFPQTQYHGAATPQTQYHGGGYGFGQDHWQQKHQQKHLPTPPPAGPLLSTQPTRLPYAQSSKEPSTVSMKQPSQESNSVEVDMDGWQVAPANLGNDVDDSNNTDDFVTFLDDAANCVGNNDDDNSEHTHFSNHTNSDTEF